MSDDLKKISDAFVSARMLGLCLSQYPGRLPETMDKAYELQDMSIARWPDDVAGWKIGLVPPDFREAVGHERLVGPIFRNLIYKNNRRHRLAMPVFEGGFAAVEAEFIFQLARDVPLGVKVDGALVESVCGSLHVGVEIASSPFKGINDLGPICVVTDFGNNYGLIVGAKIPDWHRRSWSDLAARVEIDGDVVGHANASAIPDGPTGAMIFIIELMRARGIPLKKGMYISTGAVTGVHSTEVGARSTVTFPGYDQFDLSLCKLDVRSKVEN